MDLDKDTVEQNGRLYTVREMAQAYGLADAAELRRVLGLLRKALSADNIPTPPIQSFPADPFAEEYRAWYHGDQRLAALAEAEKVQP